MFFANEAFDVAEVPASTIYYTSIVDGRVNSPLKVGEAPVTVHSLVEQKYRNIIHQAYDYSCGSAALTTLLNGYLGRKFTEKQVMDGLLKFGEYDKIVQRRGFSLLDMKRLVTALGHPSGGYKGTLDDLKKLDHPAIVPIHYANFKHFVVVKKFFDGRFFVADPALGNISFPESRFAEIWENNVMFIVFPNGFKPQPTLDLTEDDLRYVSDETINELTFVSLYLNDRQMVENADKAGTLMRVLNNDKESSNYNKPVDIPLRTYYRRK
ncbi:hypothetical protein EV700_1672 [Fluviicoccus keumensis]|uniref:Peptidase C39 domain-containing protein n=2 Tax=Fluviicoccus keumensis TaxID=1435465 RepID=A0A4Q7Z4Z7_9GAMM|nr:hypothetical protein EV700_1672 [Fluviicoccus keumensis]